MRRGEGRKTRRDERWLVRGGGRGFGDKWGVLVWFGCVVFGDIGMPAPGREGVGC